MQINLNSLFPFSAVYHVGAGPEHLPISSLSLWERARVRADLWEKWKASVAHNFPRRFLQRTLLPRFGIDPYSSGSRNLPRTTLAGRYRNVQFAQHIQSVFVCDVVLWQLCVGHLRVCRFLYPVGQPAYGCHPPRLAANEW